MKQRVVLADESTTALDVTIQASVLKMILITNDFGVVAESCDRVVVVYADEIVECGAARQVLKQPTHPYIVGLFGFSPSLTSAVDRLATSKAYPVIPSICPLAADFLHAASMPAKRASKANSAPWQTCSKIICSVAWARGSYFSRTTK